MKDSMEKVFEIIEASTDKPYVLGKHDCLKLVCEVIKAQGGKDYWGKFKGYKNKREALIKIRKIAPTFQGAVTKVLGIKESHPLHAQRGDICLYNDGEEHLGVCLGESVAVLGEKGLIHIQITNKLIKCSWRIK